MLSLHPNRAPQTRHACLQDENLKQKSKQDLGIPPKDILEEAGRQGVQAHGPSRTNPHLQPFPVVTPYKDHLPVRLLSFVIVCSLLVVCNRLGTETSCLNVTCEVQFLVRPVYRDHIHKSFSILHINRAASWHAVGLLVEQNAAMHPLHTQNMRLPLEI